MREAIVLGAVLALAGLVHAGNAGGAAAGKQTFAAKCASCHGADAKGKEAMAKMFKLEPAKLDLTASKLEAAEFDKVIKEGRNKMPKFEGKLDADSIKAVVEYVASLRPAAAAKAADKAVQ